MNGEKTQLILSVLIYFKSPGINQWMMLIINLIYVKNRKQKKNKNLNGFHEHLYFGFDFHYSNRFSKLKITQSIFTSGCSAVLVFISRLLSISCFCNLRPRLEITPGAFSLCKDLFFSAMLIAAVANCVKRKNTCTHHIKLHLFGVLF